MREETLEEKAESIFAKWDEVKFKRKDHGHEKLKEGQLIYGAHAETHW